MYREFVKSTLLIAVLSGLIACGGSKNEGSEDNDSANLSLPENQITPVPTASPTPLPSVTPTQVPSEIPIVAPENEFFVSLNGNDTTNNGSFDQPFLTLSKAQQAVRDHPNKGREAIFVTVIDGTYYLDDTLVLDNNDSGAENAVLSYRALNEGKAVLSGGKKLSLIWQTHSGNIVKAQTPDDLGFDQLFINGERQYMARYPNYTHDVAEFNGYAEDAYSQAKASEWANPDGGYLHAMHAKRWGGYSYLITGKDVDNNLILSGGKQNNRPGEMHASMRMVENIFEELDAPGEWYHNQETHTLYYYPPSDVQINNALVEVSQLEHLIEFQGAQGNAVQFVDFDGFVFRHAARTFMQTTEPLLRSDWAIHRGGAIFINGAEDISISNCELDQLGGNGIFVNNYNRRVTIEGCHIHNMGASAIVFVGDPNAVYNPLFQYAQKQSIDDISWDSGPKTDNYPADSVVHNNLIHDIGVFEKQSAGVQLSMSRTITISYTSIYDTARAGINVSEGTFGGHILEHLDVFNTVLETNDHGSFNSWGRDRYWNLKNASNDELKAVSQLDTEKTIIRNSRFRCDHGWDIDLDDGSSNYEIYNNVLLNGGLKFREGFYRQAYNNIVISNGFHPHVWYADSSDRVERNIFMAKHKPIGMPDSNWGEVVDYNTFSSQANREANISYGIDVNSNFGDPLFYDPMNGDYRVASNSPAVDMGFVNFDTQDVGVQKTNLKALRKEPTLPEIEGIALPDDAPTTYWNGALVEQLSGEAFSVYGVSEVTGGMVLKDVPEDSLAHLAGLREYDVIIGINGENVSTIERFLTQSSTTEGTPLSVQYSRNQAESMITMYVYYYMSTDSSSTDHFSDIPLLNAADTIAFASVNASPSTSNESLDSLHDNTLAENYGPIFENRVSQGIYEIQLTHARAVSEFRTYSYNQSNNRGTQNFIVQGQLDTGEWRPVHAVYLPANNAFTASKIARSDGLIIGYFKALRWLCYPVSENLEHTALQEFQIQ